MGAFIQHGVPVDQAAIGELLASKPDLKQVKDFATDLVNKAAISDDAKSELKVMIDGLKGTESAAVQEGVAIRSSNVYIEDLDSFKAGLEASKPAMPVEPLTVSARL
jgi:hypothetical protein